MTMLGMMVGNFEPAHFFESHTPALSVIMGTIYIMLMLVILFNLLIAILSDSFEKIKVRGNMRLINASHVLKPWTVGQVGAGQETWFIHSGADDLLFIFHARAQDSEEVQFLKGRAHIIDDMETMM